MDGSTMTPADFGAIMGNCNGGNNGGMWNDGAWWIIILFLFAFAGGWNNNGGGFGGSGGGYVSDNYALITDNATLERKIDGVYAGQCDSTFAIVQNLNNGFASAQNTMTQGFAGLNTALVTQGYETRNAVTQDTIGNMQNTNLLQGAIKDCCCQTQQNIKDTQYVVSNVGNSIQNQIQNCCCDVERQIERGFADTNYNMATNTCNTLNAIDKVGDRIIDYLSNDKLQTLRDENQALRLSASQQAQNAYLVEKLNPNPCPMPAYVVQPPQTVAFATNCGGVATFANSCGCGNVQ